MKSILLLATLLVPALALGDGAERPGLSQSVTSSSIEDHHQLRQSSGASWMNGEQWTEDSQRTLQQKKQNKPKKPNKYVPIICSSNNDCDVNSYCAAGVCLIKGSCATNMDCRNPSNTYSTIKCTGPLFCMNDKKCRRVCGSMCDDGSMSTEQFCPHIPCEDAEFICVSTVGKIASCQNVYCSSCQGDKCGGCNALVFDASGKHELCFSPIALP